MIALPEPADAVAATITLSEAAAIRWQVVVVGAGPAGTATALRLAESGIRVLVVDRHALPRGKVCGCCLSSRAIEELERLGAGAVVAAAAPLESVRVAHRGRSVALPLPSARVVSRERLDAMLLCQAIAAGCHWLPAVRVQSIDDEMHESGAVTLRCAGRTATSPASIQAEMAVIATGLADHVRIGRATRCSRVIESGSRIGVGGTLPATACYLPAGELVMAVGRDGYCGLVRLEDGLIDVAAALDRDAIGRGGNPAVTVAGLLEEACGRSAGLAIASAAVASVQFRATSPLTRRAALVAGRMPRILRVGDAAGYVEPFTGEGIGWALTAARILADAAVSPHGMRVSAEIAEGYGAAHRREFRAVHARCRVVAGGLRRPAVVATVFAAARVAPWAARKIVPMVIGAARRGGDR